ncbi:hypothetical protein KA977_04580 [Candidatus Dependentiae bacterium]|nr:hypothetical protein [Candidatus Dependentiae bacterium]
MRVKHHLITSIPITFLSYYFTFDQNIAFTALLSHIFIDLDHFPDYFIHCFNKKEKISLKNFFKVCYNCELGKIFLILHSYELFFVLCVISFFIANEIIFGIIIGGLSHLFLDTIFNNCNRLAYFFGYRFLNNFSPDSFYEKSNSR